MWLTTTAAPYARVAFGTCSGEGRPTHRLSCTRALIASGCVQALQVAAALLHLQLCGMCSG